MPQSASGVRRRTFLAAAGLGLLAFAQGASAADQLWWSNSGTTAAGIARAAMDGSSATTVLAQADTGRVFASVPDPARGKLYWITRGAGELWVSDLDGANRSLLLAGAGNGLDPSWNQHSLVIDPVANILYWTQDDGDVNVPYPSLTGIRWAKADGSAVGSLYAPGDVPGTMFSPRQLVIDRAHNRIWWANYYPDGAASLPAIGYANLDGSGDARALDLTCASLTGGATIYPNNSQGMVVDYSAGRIYAQVELAFDNYGHFMASTALDGSGCIQISPPYGSGTNSSRGLALDPGTQRIYNARNYSSDPRINYLDLGGSLPSPLASLPVTPSSAAVGARYPSIIKPPHVPGEQITATASSSSPGATLTCACETADDQIPLRVYRGARTESLQWYRDSVLIPGATSKTLIADLPGSYTAVLTAANVAGEMVETSNAVVIAASPALVEPKKDDAVTPKVTVPAASVTSGTSLTTVVNPSAPGTVTVAATLRGRTVCTATKKATRAVRMTVTCALGPAARAAIRIKPVTLTVTARLTDAAGKTATASRNVKVARYVVKTPVTG